jgi:hypothetical protein
MVFMRLQNRATPCGTIVRPATSARGWFTGNRGILHDDRQQVVKRWAHQQWIICLLAFKGRKRTLMSPHRYTELFFLDEATGLAAGHRPCGECQREQYVAFRTMAEAVCDVSLSSKELDRALHGDRVAWQKGQRKKQKKLFSAELSHLPDYTFICHEDEPYLYLRKHLLHWTLDGYDSVLQLSSDSEVTVLTPKLTVNVLCEGYVPVVHDSAETLLS